MRWDRDRTPRGYWRYGLHRFGFRGFGFNLLLSALHLGEESLGPFIILEFQQQLWGFFSFDSYPDTGICREVDKKRFFCLSYKFKFTIDGNRQLSHWTRHDSVRGRQDTQSISNKQQFIMKEETFFLVLVPSGCQDGGKLNPGPAWRRPSGMTAVQSSRWIANANRLIAC